MAGALFFGTVGESNPASPTQERNPHLDPAPNHYQTQACVSPSLLGHCGPALLPHRSVSHKPFPTQSVCVAATLLTLEANFVWGLPASESGVTLLY